MHPVEVIGAGEAAHMLGISRHTLIRRIGAGEVPILAKLPGKNGALVFRLADIEALVAGEHTAGAA